MISLGIVPRNDLDRWRDFASPLIRRACEKGGSDLTPEQVERAIRQDPAFCLVLVAENDRPRGLMVVEAGDDNINVTLVSGSFSPGWCDDVISQLDRIAEAVGRRKITGGGRPGWRKLFGSRFESKTVNGRHLYEREIK